MKILHQSIYSIEKFYKNIPYSDSVFVSFFTVSIWLLFMDALEFALTEQWYFLNKIDEYLRMGALLLLILVASGLQTLYQSTKTKQLFPNFFRKIINSWHVNTSIILIFIGTIFAHQAYVKKYDALQQFPKIKSISKDWSIPGDRIEILGKNFGEPFEPGTVTVGDVEFINITWTDTRVVVEQPVVGENSEFLNVCNIKNNCTKTLTIFEISDNL